jgi:hypothetical protein
MATTTNYSWTTPDDTALVKDGASAIRTLGSSVDTTVKNLNPETTLGDIAYRSSTANVKTRLGLGTAGQVLTVNSGATAPEWAAISSSANWSLLNSGGTALTGAQTVTISSISGKDKIFVIVTGASSANDNAVISVRLNTDTGNNYYWFGNTHYVDFAWATGDNIGNSGNPDSSFPIGKMSGVAAGQVFGYCRIDGCNTSGVKMAQVNGGGATNGSYTQRLYNYGGYYNSASTISSISIFSSSGNLDNGTVFVYASA